MFESYLLLILNMSRNIWHDVSHYWTGKNIFLEYDLEDALTNHYIFRRIHKSISKKKKICFLTFYNKVQKCLCMQLVCQSVHTFTSVNIFLFSYNWYTLFRVMQDMFGFVYVELIVHFQANSKDLHSIWIHRQKSFAYYLIST